MSGQTVDLTLIVMSIIVVSIGSLGIAGIPGDYNGSFCGKSAASPVPESPTEAAIVAVPGIPAIPSEPINTTIIDITISVKSTVCPLIFVTKTIVRAGNIPAHPCIPAVVPKLPTKLAVDSLTPSLFVRVEIVTGRQPTLHF